LILLTEPNKKLGLNRSVNRHLTYPWQRKNIQSPLADCCGRRSIFGGMKFLTTPLRVYLVHGSEGDCLAGQLQIGSVNRGHSLEDPLLAEIGWQPRGRSGFKLNAKT
jgi:hypothetical protein